MKTRALFAVTKHVCQGPSLYLKVLVKKGKLQTYSLQSYDPCLATVPCQQGTSMPSLVLIPLILFVYIKVFA